MSGGRPLNSSRTFARNSRWCDSASNANANGRCALANTVGRRWMKRLAFTFLLGVMALFVGFSSLSRYATPLQRENIQQPLYTVGDENYAAALGDGKNVVKFGRLPGGIYPGGLAFSTPDAASEHLRSIGKEDTWGVYMLSGDDEMDSEDYAGQRHTTVSLLVVEEVDVIEESAIEIR